MTHFHAIEYLGKKKEKKGKKKKKQNKKEFRE
jgi:hypothetical protein